MGRARLEGITDDGIHGCTESSTEVVIVLIHSHVHEVEVIHKETNILYVVKPGIYQSKIFYPVTSRLSLTPDLLFHHTRVSPFIPILMSITCRGNDNPYCLDGPEEDGHMVHDARTEEEDFEGQNVLHSDRTTNPPTFSNSQSE
jgi:hypothetical protein